MSDQILKSDLATMPANRASVLGRGRWRLWALLIEVAVIAAVGAALYWPMLTVASVVYEGPAEWEAEIRALVTIPSDGNLLHFVPADAESRIESRFSDRGDAQVRVELPNRITIRMTAFEPRLWSDGDIGLTRDGSLLLKPASRPELPYWSPGIDWEGSMPLAERAKRAAATWDELSRADNRYALITSVWTCDPQFGWTSTAADGKTCLRLGNAMIEPRARLVARLLDQGDTLLAKPCLIDARFDGQLLLSRIPEIAPDTSTVDSVTAPAGELAPVAAKELNDSRPQTAKGRT